MNKYGDNWNVDIMLPVPDSILLNIKILKKKKLVNFLQNPIKDPESHKWS